MVISNIVGLFNIWVGLMLVAAFLSMAGGLILWAIRLGTWPTYRDEAIVIMQWGVSILFVLVVLLTVAKLVQAHTGIVLFGLGLVAIAAIVWFVADGLQGGEKKEEEH